MKLLDDALERVKPYIIERFEDDSSAVSGINTYRNEASPFEGGNHGPCTARLRLDWELVAPVVNEESTETLADISITILKDDLEYLLENGDVTLFADPLLKAIDGSKKRGVEPIGIDIRSGALYSEFKERKDAYEYTMFILMDVDWPSDDVVGS